MSKNLGNDRHNDRIDGNYQERADTKKRNKWKF